MFLLHGYSNIFALQYPILQSTKAFNPRPYNQMSNPSFEKSTPNPVLKKLYCVYADVLMINISRFQKILFSEDSVDKRRLTLVHIKPDLSQSSETNRSNPSTAF